MATSYHQMSVRQLDEFYCDFDSFVSDCTIEERKMYKEELSSLRAFILHRIRNARA